MASGEAFPRGKLSAPSSSSSATAPRSFTSSSSDRLFNVSSSAAAGRPGARGDDAKKGKKRDSKSEKPSAKPSGKGGKGGAGRRASGSGPSSSSSLAPSVAHRAEELTAKRLRPGLSVLARVRRVTGRQIVLSLPSGLTAYADLQDLNEVLAAQVNAEAKSKKDKRENKGGADSDSDNDGDVAVAASSSSSSSKSQGAPLSSFFSTGQYVFATILRIGGPSPNANSASLNPALALAASLTGRDASSAAASAAASGKKKIFVSLRPELINGATTTLANLTSGSFLTGYVQSIEDHGYVIATGIDGARAFLPFTATDGTAGQVGTRIAEVPGSHVTCTVASVNRGAGTITLACKAEAVSAAVSKEATHTIYTLRPGMKVSATIDKVLPNGLALTFLGFFRATVAVAHLPEPADSYWAEKYAAKLNSNLSCRILFVDTAEKAIAVSAAPHIVALGSDSASIAAAAEMKAALAAAAASRGPAAAGSGSAAENDAEDEDDEDGATGAITGCGFGGPFFDVGDGAVIEQATVVRIDPGSGLLVAWGPSAPLRADGKKAPLQDRIRSPSVWGRTAYVHISRLSDKKVDSVEKVAKVGSTMRVRLIGFAGIEGFAQASANPKVVNASVLRVSDVKPGAILEGTVAEILLDRPNDPLAQERAASLAAGKGTVALIRLGEGITGGVTALHIADALPSGSFKSAKARGKFLSGVGLVKDAKIRCRVLTVDAATGRIQLSIKKSLVSSSPAVSGDVFSSYEEAEKKFLEAKKTGNGPLVTTGFVTSIRESGLLVTFYGNTHGSVPAADLVTAGLIPSDKVIREEVEIEGGKTATRVLIPPAVLAANFSLGQVVKVRVAHVRASKGRMRLSFHMDAEDDEIEQAVMANAAAAATSRSKAEDAPAQDDLPSAGDLVDATVVAYEAGSRIIVRVTRVHALPEDDGAQDGSIRASIAPTGTVFAELPLHHLADHPSSVSALANLDGVTSVGSTLNGLLVLAHTHAASKPGKAEPRRPLLTVSAKPLLLFAATHERDALPLSQDLVRPGQLVTGFVASVTAFAAFVRFLDGCTGVAPRTRWPKALGEDGAAVEYVVGQTVLGVVERVTPAGSAASSSSSSAAAAGSSPSAESSSSTADSKGRFTVSLFPRAVAGTIPRTHFGANQSLPSALAPSARSNAAAASLFLRSALLEQELGLCGVAVHSVSKSDDDSDDSDDEEDEEEEAEEDEEAAMVVVPSRFVYRPGSRTFGRVTMVTDSAILVTLAPPALSALPSTPSTVAVAEANKDSATIFPGVLGFALTTGSVPKGLEEGAIVPVRVLDVDAAEEMVVVQILKSATAEDAKKRKRGASSTAADAAGATPEALPEELAAPLSTQETVTAVTAAGIKLGEVVNAEVLQHRKGAAYAVVRLVASAAGADSSSLVAFAAVRDYIGSEEADSSATLAPGTALEVVVTQLPVMADAANASAAGGKKGKNKSAAAAALTAGAAAAAAVDGLLLCSAAPVLLRAARTAASGGGRRGSTAGHSTGAATARTSASSSSSSGGAGVVAVSVDTLVPGAAATAVVQKPRTKKVSRDEDSEDDEDDDAAADEEEEEDMAIPSSRLTLDPLRVRLRGVKGSYIARLSFAECADVDPYTGTLVNGETPAAAVARYRSLVAGAGSNKVQVKIVAVTIKPKNKAASKRSRTGSVADEEEDDDEEEEEKADAPSSEASGSFYVIDVTIRPSDLALPDMHLASLRTAWPTESRVISGATIVGAAPAKVAAAGPASCHAAEQDGAAAALTPGATGVGIVEGLTRSGGGLVIGLGAGVRVVVPILEAGNSDLIRDPTSGALHTSPEAAEALSAANILATHPLGSPVPIVTVSMTAGGHRAVVSIRKAAGAIAVAAKAVKATTSSGSGSAKKGGATAPSSSSTAAATARAAVASWLAAITAKESLAVGAVTLGRIDYVDPTHTVELGEDDEDEERKGVELARVPASATQLRVHLLDGSVGTVDISHTADRAQWKRCPGRNFRNGMVMVCAVVAPATAKRGNHGPALTFRQSWIEAATEAAAAAATSASAATAVASPAATESGKKKKGGNGAAAAAAPPSPLAASAAALAALEAEEAEAVAAPGTRVSGYVVNTSSKGCFIHLCRTVAARVLISDLSDRFIKDPVADFPPGRLVTGTISASDPKSGRVEMVLASGVKKAKKEAAAADGVAAEKREPAPLLRGFTALKAGDVFEAAVTSVADFGVFLSLDGTDRYADDNTAAGRRPLRVGTKAKVTPISGLCHISEVEEVGVRVNKAKLADRFAPGDKVRCVVLEVDPAKKKLAVSMRPSRLGEEEEEDDEDEDDEDDEEDDEEEDEGEDEEDDDDDEDEDAEEDEDDDDDDDDEDDEGDEDDEDEDEEEETAPSSSTARAPQPKKKQVGLRGILDVDEDDEDSDSDADASRRAARKGPAAAGAGTVKGKAAASAAGFGWDAKRAAMDEEGGEEEDDNEEEEDGDGDESLDETEGDGRATKSKSASRRASRRAKAEEEAETHRLEMRLASGAAEENPESVEEHERAVLAHPNSSFVWIRYMAWQLSLTEVDRARGVAERALNTISYREEGERLPIWTAWLSLEATYGDAASLAKVFARAVAAADPKSVHMALLSVYQRGGEKHSAACAALFQIVTKKFGREDVTPWAQWGAFLFRRGEATVARNLIAKATAVLPKSLHVELTMQFAMLEYRFSAPAGAAADGDDEEEVAAAAASSEFGLGKGAGTGSQERGRTVFGGLIDTFPKRLDIWNVFIDQEMSAFRRRYGKTSKGAAAGAAGAGPARTSDMAFVRSLFERLITLRMSSKKSKFAFKKFLAFERDHGDATGMARVRAAAKEYVERTVAE